MTALSFAAGLQSLASSATVGQVSAEVDLTATLPIDVMIQMIFTNSAAVPTGNYEVYCITSQDGTSFDGDTTYSGTAAAYTLGVAGSINLPMLGVVRPYASSGVYRKTWSMKTQLGFVARYFAIVVINFSAQTLASSGNSGNYTTVA